jgi:hypothetical protein
VGSHKSRSVPATDHDRFADELVNTARPGREVAEMVASPSAGSIVLDEGKQIALVAYDLHSHVRIVKIFLIERFRAIGIDPPFPNCRRFKPVPHLRKIGRRNASKAIRIHFADPCIALL